MQLSITYFRYKNNKMSHHLRQSREDRADSSGLLKTTLNKKKQLRLWSHQKRITLRDKSFSQNWVYVSNLFQNSRWQFNNIICFLESLSSKDLSGDTVLRSTFSIKRDNEQKPVPEDDGEAQGALATNPSVVEDYIDKTM